MSKKTFVFLFLLMGVVGCASGMRVPIGLDLEDVLERLEIKCMFCENTDDIVWRSKFCSTFCPNNGYVCAECLGSILSGNKLDSSTEAAEEESCNNVIKLYQDPLGQDLEGVDAFFCPECKYALVPCEALGRCRVVARAKRYIISDFGEALVEAIQEAIVEFTFKKKSKNIYFRFFTLEEKGEVSLCIDIFVEVFSKHDLTKHSIKFETVSLEDPVVDGELSEYANLVKERFFPHVAASSDVFGDCSEAEKEALIQLWMEQFLSGQ